jgi:regulator of protease activity HflC (stomatin/prohibitin superfamily)
MLDWKLLDIRTGVLASHKEHDMRAFFEILLLVALLAASIWAGLPWPILFVVATLVACGLKVFSFTKSDRVNSGLFFALAGFVAAWWLVSWLISYNLFTLGSIAPEAFAKNPLFQESEASRVFTSLLLGFILCVTVYLLLLLPLTFIAARMVYGIYDQFKGHELAAMRSLVSTLLGMNNGTVLVKEGRFEITSGQSDALRRFGGPGTLVVQEGHAVILEKAGALSRIVGRGITELGNFERVGIVADLTGKSQAVEEESVVTRDGVILDQVNARVFYRIIPGDPAQPGYHQNGRFPFNDEQVYKLWNTSGGPTWQDAVKGVAKTAVRDVIARYTLDDILCNPDDFRKQVKGDKAQAPGSAEYQGELCAQVNRITKNFGIEATAGDISDIQVPEAARRQLMEKWMAEVERSAILARSQADATATSVQEMARAEARKRTIGMMSEALGAAAGPGQQISADQIVRLRLIEALEKMATEHASGLFLPNELLAWLRSDQGAGGPAGGAGGRTGGAGGPAGGAGGPAGGAGGPAGGAVGPAGGAVGPAGGAGGPAGGAGGPAGGAGGPAGGAGGPAGGAGGPAGGAGGR